MIHNARNEVRNEEGCGAINPVVVVLVAVAVIAEAQQPAKVPRIGYLSRTGDSKNPGPQVEGFRQGLRDLGYIEGKNILVEYRYIEGKSDSIPSLAAELVQLKVDVLVLGPLPAIRAAKQATKMIPIVMVTTKIPSQRGLSIAWRALAEISRGSPHFSES